MSSYFHSMYHKLLFLPSSFLFHHLFSVKVSPPIKIFKLSSHISLLVASPHLRILPLIFTLPSNYPHFPFSSFLLVRKARTFFSERMKIFFSLELFRTKTVKFCGVKNKLQFSVFHAHLDRQHASKNPHNHGVVQR
jgi:hypothetical protein